jgi:hypothetical protein
MSITYSYPCPKCSRMTQLSAGGICENPVKGGRVCGYELPRELCDFNSMVKKKIEKHTTEPTGNVSKVSFNPSTGFYLENLETARAAGDIYLDPKNGYFCTYITPSSCTAIATLYSGSSANQFAVSGYKMPLNSKLHQLHGHYDNLEAEMIYVAAPVDVTVEYPSSAHPDEFRIIQSGNLIAAWNTQALSGFAGSHIVIK